VHLCRKKVKWFFQGAGWHSVDLRRITPKGLEKAVGGKIAEAVMDWTGVIYGFGNVLRAVFRLRKSLQEREMLAKTRESALVESSRKRR